MESRAERAKRYKKEAEKYAKLAASGPQDMMNDVHRRLAERYKQMASDLERRETFTFYNFGQIGRAPRPSPPATLSGLPPL
jgi:hypothetical protein